MTTEGTLAWLDGSVVAANEATVSVLDAGFSLGRAVFTTLLVRDGRPQAWERHLRRLTDSAHRLGLPEVDPRRARIAVDDLLAADSSRGLRRLRLTWTAGRPDHGGTLVATLGPQTPWPGTTTAVAVAWVRNERSAVAGIKTTSYVENVVARSEAERRGASEALLANSRGELCEGTASNVFVVVAGVVLTPSLASGCLPGIARELVLASGLAQEETLPMSVLATAEEVFLTSSTRQVHGVHELDGRLLDAPGPLTQKCAAAYAALIAAEAF